jgi:hypothetical protein
MSDAKYPARKQARIDRYLANIPKLPDSAPVPIPVVAVHDGVTEKTVRDTYPLVNITERLKGVRLGYLRNRKAIVAA